MKKAIFFVPVCLVVVGLFYHIVQIHRLTAGLAGRYPGLSINGQIKKGRSKYVQMGR